MKALIRYQRKLNLEYIQARQKLTRQLKKRLTPSEAKALINESILSLTGRQSHIIARYMTRSFANGTRAAMSEIKGVTIAAAAGGAGIVFDSSSIADPKLKRITKANLGAIGRYNVTLNKQLIKQYNTLLSDNKLLNSLNRDGWTPWLGETLKKRGIDPKVISLVKQQKTTAKMIQIIKTQGIQGGMHPDQVARRLIPHVNRYFGPEGVTIDNVGKTVKRFKVDANGNYEWVNHNVTRKYHATPRTYSRLVARNSMKEAHREAYYQSLEKTNLVDHYISVSVMDARTCGNCAMMHGQIVTHADGPQYHGNCHCDLKPVWKRDSILGDKNKPDRFYERQRDLHFLRMNDLKRFNETMPSGSKLANFALLPDSAKSGIMPGPLQMVKIRHTLMGEPAKIAPLPPKDMPYFTDDDWRREAKTLYDKTAKDGVEHMRIITVDGSAKEFTGTSHGCGYTNPKGQFSSLHTHPGVADSPLSNTDMATFLGTKNNVEMGATTKDSIYVIRRRKGYKPFSPAQKKTFQLEFKKEEQRIMREIDGFKLSNADYHRVWLEAGETMAKRHNLIYEVIDRGV